MDVFENLNNLFDRKKSTEFALTIGNFDGVHSGHRTLLKKILDDCRSKNLELVLISFIPHPRTLLDPECTDFLLNMYEERKELLASLGIQNLIEINFTRDFSLMDPKEFFEKICLNHQSLKLAYIGHDFRFGRNKLGGPKEFEELFNGKVVQLDEFLTDSLKVSSSRIRKSLEEGEVDEAQKLLGREFFLTGLVTKGEGRGRRLGFPTANLKLNPYRLVPKKGVYVSRAECKGMLYNSVTNIGVNPTFGKKEDKLCVETHLLDFDQDLYGSTLRVYFFSRIRDEKRFDSANDLIRQIEKDINWAKGFTY